MRFNFLTPNLLLCAIYFTVPSFATAQIIGVTYEVDTVFAEPTTFNTSGEALYEELEGYTTYKVFAEFTNPTDELASIYADEAALGTEPFFIDAPCGCFNPLLGDVLLGGTQNPALIEFFPEVAYDTYWTLGFASGEEFVGTNMFYSSTTMCSEEEDAGLIFTVNPQSAGDDLRIQIAQITTCGSFELHACLQVFVEGVQAPYQEWCMDGDGTGPLVVTGLITGCTDPLALNFDPNANYSNDSCEYDVTGCTDPLAMNYDPDANVDDGNCNFFEPSCAAIGDTAANTWDLLETGFYPDTLHATHGVADWSWSASLASVFHLSETIADGNGVVYQVISFTVDSITLETPGISWTPSAFAGTIYANEQFCLQGWGTPEAVGVYEVTLSGTLILDIFGEPTSLEMQSFSFYLDVADNPDEVLGCTYSVAYNFNTYANTDDGSCVFSGCTDPLAINFDAEATVLDNSCLYAGCTDEGALNYGGAPNEYYIIEEVNHVLPYPLNFGQAFDEPNDDWYSDPISLGWEFTLFGVTYNTLQVSSNGYLFFGESDFGYSPWQIQNMQLPNDFLPYPAIFAAYHDMNPTECGEIFYGVDGEAPNRSFVVSWNEVCPFSSYCQDVLPSSVQVILREGTNEIEFHVLNRSSCSEWNENALLIGMQSEEAVWASTPAGFNNETSVVSERSWIAYPPTSPGPAYDDGSCLYAGCTDPVACNYLAEAIEDDGSCVYVADACGVGTEWDEDTQSCLPIEGFCQTDLDGDGLVAVSDLLLILADFGYECPE